MKILKSKVGLLLGLAVIGVSIITIFNGIKSYYDIVDFRRAEVQKQVESFGKMSKNE